MNGNRNSATTASLESSFIDQIQMGFYVEEQAVLSLMGAGDCTLAIDDCFGPNIYLADL